MKSTEQPTPTGAEQSSNNGAQPNEEAPKPLMEQGLDALDGDEPASATPADEGAPADETGNSNDGNDESKDEDETPVFDEAVLETKMKRLGEELTIKEFLTKFPTEASEIIQKGYDYQKSKLEVKELEAGVKQRESMIDAVVLTNLAYEVDLPLKTREDFENDIRYKTDADIEKAFADYKTDLTDKIKVVREVEAQTEKENALMVEQFTKDFPDVNVDELNAELSKYLNASMSKGRVPFPKDSMKIFYQGLNHEKLKQQAVEKAVEEALSKEYDTLNGKVKPNTNGLGKVPQHYAKPSKVGVSRMEEGLDNL